MGELAHYIKEMVEPTVEEFKIKPHSNRHAYIACVVLFHCVDRVAYPKNITDLRKQWRTASPSFELIDIVAHDFKHVEADRARKGAKVVSRIKPPGLFGAIKPGATLFNDTGKRAAITNVLTAVEEALTFVQRKFEASDVVDSCTLVVEF
jgi:hypothetical protein